MLAPLQIDHLEQEVLFQAAHLLGADLAKTIIGASIGGGTSDGSGASIGGGTSD